MQDKDKVDLTKTITRTITVEGLPTIISQETQQTTFSIDNVTNKIIGYGNDISNPVKETDSWQLIENKFSDFLPLSFNGYHPDIAKVKAIEPKADGKYDDVEINYVADPVYPEGNDADANTTTDKKVSTHNVSKKKEFTSNNAVKAKK